MNNKKKLKPFWVNNFISIYINKTIIYCVLFFIIIPVIIYVLSYLPYTFVLEPGHDFSIAYKNSINMYEYHKNLVATHPYQSSWWEWPIVSRPICYYLDNNTQTLTTSNITSMGNPAIWWTGIVAFIVALIIAIKKREKKIAPVLFVAIIFQYIPWILVPRIAFIYHYFSIVPFIILLIVYVIKNILEKYPEKKKHIYVYLGIVLLLFILFYPVISGMEVSSSYTKFLKWSKYWYF